jgi:hypothetical protein
VGIDSTRQHQFAGRIDLLDSGHRTANLDYPAAENPDIRNGVRPARHDLPATNHEVILVHGALASTAPLLK